ncbi:MAG: transporter substrate-binding domain-containing protein, partial [Pseudomonadota bacterium]
MALGLAALPALMMGPAAADLSEVLKTGTVKVAVPENFPPFGSLGADGEYQGYDVDVAKMIAKDLGVKLELVP